MNVVDSSGWLEYLADGPNASFFASPIEDPGSLVVPSISLYEVFKKILLLRGESAALRVAALMTRGQVTELSAGMALDAAKLSVEIRLPMADSIILATARAHDAILWTQDADFSGMDGVEYIPRV